ncbi:MucBP domain-containing protein [Lacticaseibacillus zeae]|uniref:MucBP domain-containing protein n=1 Tax=Lacticaseibacillus zeae subsp. silagei TaxID=3068307 RepID=A0ABD7Z8N9_LACZE|nr:MULTISPECIES: MucBP domain-containing protein [Lacticaseibacillus]MDE3316654.1 MucBP domain-containing protein [Lacticaseibacillus zeae]WLV83446.1 MucBP domain-containing protein [Lacticaseibacillus sp. NCIMB 15475]
MWKQAKLYVYSAAVLCMTTIALLCVPGTSVSNAASNSSTGSGSDHVATQLKTTQDNSVTNLIPNPTNDNSSNERNGVAFSTQFQTTYKNGTSVITPVSTNSNSITNFTDLSKVDEISTLKNSNSTAENINVIFETPDFKGVDPNNIEADVADAPTFSQDMAKAGLKVLYSGKPGVYDSQSDFLSQYKWSQLIAVQVMGDLPANSKITMTMPLTLSNTTDKTIGAGDYNRSTLFVQTLAFGDKGWGSTTTTRFSEPYDMNFTGYFAAKRDSATQYTALPDSIQKLMPTTTPNADFTAYNFSNLLDQPDKTGTVYKGGLIKHDLTRIMNAIKDQGLSVDVGADGQFVKSYLYDTVSDTKVQIVDENGKPISIPKTDCYVEIHQVIDTKDTTIKEGSTWNPKDNLVSAVSPKDSSDISSQIKTDGTVDTSKPGTYAVKYSYTLGGVTISKTAHVTVTAPAPVKGGNVTVSYETTDGTKLAPDVTLSGNVGDTYTATQKQFEGYEFKSVTGQPTGKFTSDPQTVVFVYEKHGVLPSTGGSGSSSTVPSSGSSSSSASSESSSSNVPSSSSASSESSGSNVPSSSSTPSESSGSNVPSSSSASSESSSSNVPSSSSTSSESSSSNVPSSSSSASESSNSNVPSSSASSSSSSNEPSSKASSSESSSVAPSASDNGSSSASGAITPGTGINDNNNGNGGNGGNGPQLPNVTGNDNGTNNHRLPQTSDAVNALVGIVGAMIVLTGIVGLAARHLAHQAK